jgi:nucleotide-binding universal stress UspA family protein
MGKILCATRGGEASHRTQDAAIALAKKRGDELVFLFVADISFLNQIAAPLVVDVESQLVKMGQFQLTIVQERARERGLEVEIAIRRGKLRAELVAAAAEFHADLIVLGRPVDREAVFDDTALEALATGLQAVTGVEVRIL